MPHQPRYVQFHYQAPTTLPLFKFVVVVGTGLFVSLMALNAYLESPQPKFSASASLLGTVPGSQ
jgi:hypothetical protein